MLLSGMTISLAAVSTPAAAQEEAPAATPTENAPVQQAAPSPAAVQPNTVSNLADTELVVTGAGFVDGAVVVLSGIGGLNTTFVSSSLLRAVLPAGAAPGVYSLTVVNPDAASATLANALIVTGPPAATHTPAPTNTPAPTAFVRPLLVVNSYGASSAEITPGANLDFEMTIGNAGQSRATNVVATFIAGDFVARNTGGVRALGTLDPGQSSRFWQPLNASSGLTRGGIATLEVKVDYTDVNGTAYSETFALTFPVVRAAAGGAAPTATPTATATTGPLLRPQLIVTGYDAGVEQLQPGQHFTLRLTVQNQGNADAQRVTMILGGGSTSGGSVDGTPVPGGGGVSGAGGEFSKFAPVGSSNVLTLGDLDAAQRLETSMALIVNAATEPGAYPVKVSFVYIDEKNASFVDDQVITLLVVRRPSAEMNFYAPAPPLFAGEPGSLPLQLVNSGVRSTVFGAFSVTAGDATIENGSVFVGNLEPGGFYPLDAMIIPTAPGPLDLLLSVSYTDDFGQPQTITRTLTVEVLESFMPEEPFEPFPGEGEMPAEPEPETLGQKIWRFILGLLGLSSGVPEPAQPDAGPMPGEGEFFPGSGPGRIIVP